jgi:hypothetical protein
MKTAKVGQNIVPPETFKFIISSTVLLSRSYVFYTRDSSLRLILHKALLIFIKT